MPYDFSSQCQIAADFISYVNEKEFEKAFELTQKNIYTGKTLEEFIKIALFEICCSGYQFAYTHPLQTNGNRLRRWLRGSEVEIYGVSVEFTGPTLLRITLRHLGNNQWKIFYFASHAG
ncbi:MAG: hypothetical protein LBP92_01290 [Deltaproteobacteria bacterium]|nr:hypothetical protein [Deltaproteobacteria bacterium]